jgi:hypothetical protein
MIFIRTNRNIFKTIIVLGLGQKKLNTGVLRDAEWKHPIPRFDFAATLFLAKLPLRAAPRE